MRTTKSGGLKKTPASKKNSPTAGVASAEKTPETPASAPAKATPKSGPGRRAAKGAGRQSTPRAAPSAKTAAVATRTAPPAVSTPAPISPAVQASSDPKVEHNVEEMASSSNGTKVTSFAKPTEKKTAAELKSCLSSSTKAAFEEPMEESDDSEKQLGPKNVGVRKDAEPTKAGPKKTEEDESVILRTDGKEKKQEPPKSDVFPSHIKKEEVESKSIFVTESEVVEGGETFVKAEVLEREGLASEESEEEQDSENENEEMTGDDLEVEEVAGEEEAGLKEEEQIEMTDIVKERKKKKEQEIFVGGLDRDATEEDLRKVFEKVGIVEDVRLHRDFSTNKNKGFAFVKFANKEQAIKAITELKNPIIRGKRCGVAASEDNDTLFLGNICNTWTKEAIKRRLKEYGVDGLETITLVEDTQNEGISRGFAFLEFSCHEYAMNAYKRLQKPDVVFGHAEWSAKVGFAEPLREPDAEVMAQVKSVFIDGMPPYWDEDRVKEHFKGHGEIERIVLARNMPTARRKDFGFVNFTTHEAAVACAAAINNTELGDGKSKMKARARLANPLPKTQAVKGGIRGGFRIGHSGVGFFPRFGRGFGRGRLPFARAGFAGRRGFHIRGRGRGGRFSFPLSNNEGSDFRGRRPSGVRGGGRGSFRGIYEEMGDEFSPRLNVGRPRHGAFDSRHGRPFQVRREPLGFDGEFGGPFDGGHFLEDPYYYGDMGHGMKRPYSMMEHDTDYLEPGGRVRPRYDIAEPLPSGARYRDPMGSAGATYKHDYYGSDYGGSGYSSLYRGEGSGSEYYY